MSKYKNLLIVEKLNFKKELINIRFLKYYENFYNNIF